MVKKRQVKICLWRVLRASDGHRDLMGKIGVGKYRGQSCSCELLAGSALGGLGLNEECGTALARDPGRVCGL